MRKFYDYVFASAYEGVVLSVDGLDYRLSDLHALTLRYEAVLQKYGSLEGKRVGILVPHIAHYAAIFLAANKLGGIVAPYTSQAREQDLTSMMELTQPHLIFTVEEHGGYAFGKLIREWAAKENRHRLIFVRKKGDFFDDVCEVSGTNVPIETQNIHLIGCTSGSTGVPKGVMHTEDSLIYWCDYLRTVIGVEAGNRLFQMVPPTSLFGLFWFLGALHYRMHAVYCETFDVFQMVQLFETYDCQIVNSTPSAFRALLTVVRGTKPDIFRRLELCIISGEVLSTELVATISAAVDCELRSIFGLSEQGFVMYAASDLRNGANWSVNPGIRFKLQDMSPESIGEIAFNTPEGRFYGYYGRPDLTAEVLGADGWFCTGDLVQLDSNGRIRIIGRKKDLIKKGGVSVVPGEIEHYLEGHEHVKQAIVLGNLHPVYGEEIVAFILPEGELNIGELRQFCLHKIAGYKIPDRFEIIDSVPLIQGKADKVSLKKLLAK